MTDQLQVTYFTLEPYRLSRHDIEFLLCGYEYLREACYRRATDGVRSPPDQRTDIMQKWLDAGNVEERINYPSRMGKVVKSATIPRLNMVNFVCYADDFVITGKSKRLLEQYVKLAVELFLAERGLALSEEKTMITYIRN